MMSSSDRTLVVCENERAWMGRGFSHSGLLPNDRGAFSSEDGSLSFASLQQAQESLLLLMTCYCFVVDNQDTSENDEEHEEREWYYAWDFSARAIAKAERARRGPLHWIRFRLWQRAIRLDVSTMFQELKILNNHVDSHAVDRLSTQLLHVSVYLSLLQSPNSTTTVTDAVMLPIKKRLLGELREFPVSSSDESCFELLDSLCARLEMLAEEKRTLMKHLLSQIGPFARRESEPTWKARCKQVDSKYWPERNVLAGWTIRWLDGSNGQMHCRYTHCAGCDFLPLPCPNEDCTETMSQKYLATHKQTCPFEVVSCPCGESFPRHHERFHRIDECPLRDVTCPYSSIGCKEALQAREIPSHIASHTQQHLDLTLTRLLEVQTVCRNQNKRILSLEQETAQLKQRLATQQELAQKEQLAATKTIKGLTNRLTSTENSMRKELQQIRKEQARSHGR